MKRIAVIGGVHASEEALKTAEHVGYEIVKSGHILYEGGAGGVGTAARQGGLKAAQELGYDPNHVVFTCLPKFNWVKAGKSKDGYVLIMGGDWAERRRLMMEAVDGAVAISGEGGTANEISIGVSLKKPVIPIGGEGSAEDHRFESNGCLYISDTLAPLHAVQQVLEALGVKYEPKTVMDSKKKHSR